MYSAYKLNKQGDNMQPWCMKLHEAQTGIKSARRNINNLRYVDDATLMTESEEELKSLLIRAKQESERASLN